jgi:hypothetical protein
MEPLPLFIHCCYKQDAPTELNVLGYFGFAPKLIIFMQPNLKS